MTIIVRADQSPLNKVRWMLELACGHQFWKSTNRRPKPGAKIACPMCRDEAAGVPTAEEVRVEHPDEETWAQKMKRLR